MSSPAELENNNEEESGVSEKSESVKDSKEEEEEENDEMGESEEKPPKEYPPLTEKDFVCLISNDNHEHYIRRELAVTSKTIRDMLNVPGTLDNRTVHLHMTSSRILRQICNFLVYRKHYLDNDGEVEPFKVPDEDAVELFMASGFLEI